MEGLRDVMVEVDPRSYEDLFRALGDYYNEYAERMMNLESGGQGGRPLPDMESVLGRLKEFEQDFVGTFVELLQARVYDEPENELNQRLLEQVP